MALILGIQFFHIRVILRDESDARTHRTPKALRAKCNRNAIMFCPAVAGLSECVRVLASLLPFWNLTMESCLGFGTWHLGFRATSSAQEVDEP